MPRLESLEESGFSVSIDDKVAICDVNRPSQGIVSWRSLRTATNVIGIVLAIAALCIGIAALTKTDKRTILEMQALKQMNGNLNSKVSSLIEENRGLREDYIQLSEVFSLNTTLQNVSQMNDALNDKFIQLSETILQLREEIKHNLTQNNASGTFYFDAFLAQLARVQPGWFTPFNGYQYHITDGRRNFNESRRWCQSQGADLATVGMRNYATRVEVARAILPPMRIWVGLHDMVTEGVYEWVDGVIATDENIRWIRGEPNNFGGNEDCTNITPQRSTVPFGGNDDSCVARFYGVCEKPLS